jgi:Tol biopolymer transport system component
LYTGGGHDVEVSEIFLTDTLGSAPIQLTNNKRDNRAPTWSPDGKRIAWSSNLRLCVMNADVSNQHQITYGHTPSWSIDDTIVFSHANSDYTKEVLYIISSDGTNKKQITF